MKSLVFKEVLILSKVEKAARKETFSASINVLTGENDVGKSTLIKSLYHTLGADVPQLQNTRWKRAKSIYCVRLALGSDEYFVLRDEKYFGVFDGAGNLLGRYTGISGDKGVAHFINPLFNFRIELERTDDSKLGLAGPAYYFLPFYVDQDEGWTRSWASFAGLQQFSLYRKNMLEYHLGVRPQSYYDARKLSVELSGHLAKLGGEKSTLISVRDSYQKRKAARQVDLDPSVFRKEVEELVDQYNQIYGRQQQVPQELKDVRNERHVLENEVLILRRAIKELDADYALAEDPETPDPVGCPTCGTEIANSIVERFGILDDIDYCFALIDQRKKKLVDVQLELEDVEERYRQLTAELAPIDELLKRKRENVTFAEFVSSEGMKEMMESLSEDINALVAQEVDVHKSLSNLTNDLKVDSKRKNEINEYYQAKMKEFLGNLNVHVLEARDYKTYDRQIKNNALGSDLPRSPLAQYIAFLHTMAKFNPPIVCPLVLDSPLQQEQDDANVDAIFKFIFAHILSGQQLIMGTLSIENVSSAVLPASTKEIKLEHEYGLLRKAQYADVLAQINNMHELTLATE
jgi:predicted  nucleic acid-binding Zn-ribbon protein